MMKIAKFEKVSFEQFEKDWLKNFPGLLFRAEEMFGQKYKDIILYNWGFVKSL